MGLLSLFKNLNLGFGMPHIPTNTSTGTMEAKEFKEVKQDAKMQLGGDRHDITGVDKDKIIRSDETGSCEFGMEWQFNHPLKEGAQGLENMASSENVGQIECKGAQGLENMASSENVGQIECKLNFLGLPIRPGEKKCPFYMRTGGCKFASCCRFHHPDPTAVVRDSFPDRDNSVPSQDHNPVEQLCETPRPSEKSSNEQINLLDSCSPNLKLQQTMHWNGNQTTTSPARSREMSINVQRKALANNDTACEFSGGVESHHFEEYPQRPHEPKCQYFMKTGYCKFKSACRYHHPKSNVSFLGLPQILVGNNYQHCGPGPVEQFPSENTSNEQTVFLGPSSSHAPGMLTFNQGLEPNAQWNVNKTSTSPLHTREMNINDQRKALANNGTACEFNGNVESQLYEEYPQRPHEPKCQYFIKTGYCKFKSACRYHHPKSNVSFLGLPQRLVGNDYQLCGPGPVEQLRETPLLSEITSNELTTFLGLSSSYAPDMLASNQGLEPNAQWNGNQTVTSLLHPPDIKIIEQKQEFFNKDAACEFSGVEPQQYDDYPQRPNEPECQYFMKSGYCKFKSACRYHHPKSNLSSLGFPLKTASNNYVPDGSIEQLCEIPLPSENASNDQRAFLCPSSFNVPGLFTPNQGLQPNVSWKGYQMAASPLHLPEIKMDERGPELANKNTAYEFNGGVKPQQVDEYPQRPNEPECKYFMKTGYCKFKSACRCHHPKSNPSVPAPSPKTDKPICTHYSRRGICKFGSACRYSHHMEHT